MSQEITHQRFTRAREAIFYPFESIAQLRPGDMVHFHTKQGLMDFVIEDITVLDATYRCGRVHRMALHVGVPRGEGHGTAMHRAVEQRFLELGLVFATADNPTLDGNPVTTALHDRLLGLYETVDAGDNCYLLIKPRGSLSQPDPTEDSGRKPDPTESSPDASD